MPDALDLTTLGVTDEAVAIEATSDFFVVAPADQRVADGEDGALPADDRWALAWAGRDFNTLGVRPGMMIQLDLSKAGVGTTGKPATRERFDQFAVEAVGSDASRLVLRRKGFAAGSGTPPGPAGGLAGVRFKVSTCLPQIRVSARKIRDRFGITAPAQVQPADDFIRAVVCDVLANLYFAQSRMAGEEKADHYAAKARVLKAELKEILAGLDAQYDDTTLPGSRFTISTPTPRFGCYGPRDPGWRA